MTNTIIGRIVVLMLLLSAAGMICQQAKGINADTPAMSLCELLAHSGQYIGRTVSVRARITAGKHVTGIWVRHALDGARSSLARVLSRNEEAGRGP